MLKDWLNKISSIRDYNDLLKYGYIIDSVEDKELVDVWNKIIDACIEIEEDKFIYQVKPMSLLKSHRMVVDFFRKLYDDSITEELFNFLEIIIYRKATDYKNANGNLTRSFEIGSRDVGSFTIDLYDDILTSDLLVHEFTHALYSAPIECVYDEVLPMTFEKIFASINHSDLEILYSLSAFKSIYYNGTLKVKGDTLNGKIKCINKLFAKKYLIGYITSLYLMTKYMEDPNIFRKIISAYRDSNNSSKDILNYYGFKFNSNEVDNLVEKDIVKVKKRMYS